jgi:hypothetical protein
MHITVKRLDMCTNLPTYSVQKGNLYTLLSITFSYG